MTIKKVDEAAYQQGFTQAVNGGKVRAVIEVIDFEEVAAKDQLGSGPSSLIGFLDGLLQRFSPPNR